MARYGYSDHPNRFPRDRGIYYSGYRQRSGYDAHGGYGPTGAEGYGYDAPRGLEGYGYYSPTAYPHERGFRQAGRYASDLDSGAGYYGSFGYAEPSPDWPAPGWSEREFLGDYGQYRGYGRTQDERMGNDAGWTRTADRPSKRARDIMTENPEAVVGETSLTEAAQLMRDLDVGIIPVVDSTDSNMLEGVVTDRDIVVRAVADAIDLGEATVGDVMSSDIATCHPDDDVDEVMGVMRHSQVRRVPIVEEDGRLVGIVAQADLSVHYGELDEDRELAVEETIERISEPARPEWGTHRQRGLNRGGQFAAHGHEDWRHEGSYDRDFGDRMRDQWRRVKRSARDMMGNRYDGGWR